MSDTALDTAVVGIPPGLAALLGEARQAMAASQEAPEWAVQLVDRLDIVSTNLELALDMFTRLAPLVEAWNTLAANMNAVHGALGKPMARLGLELANLPTV